MKHKTTRRKDDLRPEYAIDYSKAVRGKYFRRLQKERTNVIVLDPDVAMVFIDSTAVNDVLRSLLAAARATQRLTTHPKRAAGKRVAA